MQTEKNSTGGQLGTEAIKKVLMFGLLMVASMRDILKDKKVTFQEAIQLLPQVMQLPDLITQLPEVKAEWNDRDQAELEEINAFVKNNFDLDDDKLEAAIEGAFDVVISIINEIDLIGDMKVKTPAAGTADGQGQS